VDDLNLAKRRLNDNNLTLVIAKEGKIIFESNSDGINDLIRAIDLLKDNLNESSVADSTVGKAVALLFVYSKVSSVFAKVMSKHGMRVLEKANVQLEYETLIPSILNKEKTDMCPLEKLTLGCESPGEAYRILKSFIGSSSS
jgi:hypothetical protein